MLATPHWRLLAVSFAVSLAWPLACAATGGDGQQDSSGSGGAGFDAGDSTATGFDPDAACATASDEAKNVPVNMYIMFDKSGSMAGELWKKSSSALQSFFMAPQSAGLRVALRFFPDDGCDTSCNDVQACATPKVKLAALTELSAPADVQEQLLLDAFSGVIPSGGTPMSLALDGAYIFGQSVVAAQPGDKMVVLLVTDGEPTDCVTDPGALYAAAANALSTSGIITFAIGLEGSKEAIINGMAHAGGTEKGIFVGSANADQELLTALNEIRDATIACTFQVPTSDSGDPVDPTKVNVLYTPSGSMEQIPIGQVPGAADCGPKAAWYYDDPINPTKIILCPDTCAALQAEQGAKLDILLGCGTIPA